MKFKIIKEKLKKNRLTLLMYSAFFKVLFALDPIIPMSLPIRLYYFISTGKKINLDDPQGLNEKIQWLKVYYRDPLYVQCSDKYLVREYVEKIGRSEILNELYGVYNNVDEINFRELPHKFALKTTHGCATNIICDNKDQLNIEDTKDKVNKWMKQTTGKSTGEKHYQYIKPRVIIEKYIGDDSGTLPIDYKIYCFNGKPYCVCVYSDRDKITLRTNRAYFDFEWNPLNIVTEQYSTDPNRFEKPKSINVMYEIAKELSRPFPFVRVDLYEYNGKVIFGELTFTPTGGLGKAFTEEANLEFGRMIKLPEKSKTRSYIK